MTSTQSEERVAEPNILRTDSRQRVWVSRERRQAILEEFERSGASAMRFAAYSGIKYSTFANWVARRRRAKNGASGANSGGEPKWLEAIVDERSKGQVPTMRSSLRVQLPGGAYLEVSTPEEAKLAAQLVASL